MVYRPPGILRVEKMKRIKTQFHFTRLLNVWSNSFFIFVILRKIYRFSLADLNKLYKHVRKEV